MTVHVMEETLVHSLSQRAFIVGVLIGTLHTIKEAIRDDRPELIRAIDERLQAIYPLVEDEFYGHLKRPDEPQPTQGTTEEA